MKDNKHTSNEQVWHALCMSLYVNNLKQYTMKSLILIPFLIVAILTALVGLAQFQTWEQFGMLTFAITISGFILGLIATEK